MPGTDVDYQLLNEGEVGPIDPLECFITQPRKEKRFLNFVGRYICHKLVADASAW